MAKDLIYICDSCGEEFLKWAGKCPKCNQWNTIKELRVDLNLPQSTKTISARPQKLSQINIAKFSRLVCGIAEFDTVLGGGFTPGSIILIGGEPGIGKSTIILQIADKISSQDDRSSTNSVLYVSGEESLQQIKSRADRLKIKGNIELLPENNVDVIVATAKKSKPLLLIVDSIQTIYDEKISASQGSISQVKASALKLQKFAKETGVPTILIGHVTKSGAVAGPKTLEHLVDTVIYLEGERFHSFRILRASKNRFGSVNEVGIFEMTGEGFREVKNPSESILAERNINTEGSSIAVILEGTRPFLIEIQALASKSYLGFPQRKSAGFDYNRMQLLLAILGSRAKLPVYKYDIYLNIVGGLKIADPAADLATLMSIASAIIKKPIPKNICFLGEVGLGGELRSVTRIKERIKEAKALGINQIIVPRNFGEFLTNRSQSFKIKEMQNINQVLKLCFKK